MVKRPTNSDKVLFIRNLMSTIFGDNDIMPGLQFYMTHYCNLRCPGCYMAAGPHRSRAMIPSRDIDFYLRELSKNSDFYKSIVFSGGEIFTLPVDYVQYNIQNAIDLGLRVEIKTNGMWVNDVRRTDEIFNMLRGLKIREPLSMAISVDDKIHPAASADCFVDIATRLADDDKLSQNIALRSFGFLDSIQFFDKNIMHNPRLKISDFKTGWPEYAMCEYRIGKLNIESFFGNFIDSGAPQSPISGSNVVVDMGEDYNVAMFFFHPDGTVGFENEMMQSVGRVPYIDNAGRYKSINTLINEIATKMVQDYIK